MPFRTAIVVGASSGIGEALVRALAAEGTRVVALARREAELARIAAAFPNVRGVVHDVRDAATVPALFDRLAAELGGCDLLVYNAGVMPRVAEDEYDFEKDRAMVEVNLLGAMAWLNRGAAYMEARRAGTLCGISSVAGERGRRGNPAYHSTKAALTTFLESLRNRLHRHGVAVVTVKPGPVDTEMIRGLDLPLRIDADEAAAGILRLLARGTGEGYVPAVWGPIMWAIRAVPSRIFRRLSI